MSALSPSQQPTVLFPIYINSIWTIRCLVDKTIDPATKRRLKIVGFIFDAIERTEKCSRKKNIKSFLTRGSLRMQAVKLATTADISLSLPICLRGTFQYVTFMHYSLATFFFIYAIDYSKMSWLKNKSLHQILHMHIFRSVHSILYCKYILDSANNSQF